MTAPSAMPIIWAGKIHKETLLSGSGKTIREMVSDGVRKFGRRTFLHYGEESYSFKDMDLWTDRVASGLNRSGLRHGDRIALLLSNRPEFVFFLMGAPKTGIVVVPCDPDLPSETLVQTLKDTAVAAVVTESQFLDRIRPFANDLPQVRHWIHLEDEGVHSGSLSPFVDVPILQFWPDLDPSQPAAILFTRGTSGPRKGVVLSHRNFVSNCTQTVQPYRINDTDRFLCVQPLFNASTLVLQVLSPWTAGASCVLGEEQTPEDILRRVAAHGITVIAGPPEFHERLADADSSRKDDLSSLRLAICSSGAVKPDVLRRFEKNYAAFLVESYGLLEATCIICSNPYTGVRKSGALGLPLQGQECRIVDEHGQAVGTGMVGEILTRGPNIMTGYFNDPDATSKVIRNGWLHTGDRGYVDEDGYYFLEN